MNLYLNNNYKQKAGDSFEVSPKKKPLVKVETKDPEENQIIEGYEGACEQCEEERIKKPCSICGE